MKHAIALFAAVVAAVSVFGRDITGRVVGHDNTPLEFASVVLYRDSTYLAGDVTGADGSFCLSTESADSLTARVSFVGCETYVGAVPESGHVGVVCLAPSAVALDEVVAVATRRPTTLRGNALVTEIDGGPLAVAGTARDVLEQVPMIVNNGGSLEVFGKGAPEIYINGRKVNDRQELEQLSSHDMKSVSVITNPSAAYAADVKSVVLIRTKPPKGDGFSVAVRADNGFQRYFRTGNSIDLKYRTRGLEVFANYGWWRGASHDDRTNDMTTTAPAGQYSQRLHTLGKQTYNDMTGKIGFSYMFNDRHSIGARWQSGWNRHHLTGAIPGEVWRGEMLIDRYNSSVDNRSTALPRHEASLYYNGSVGRLAIEFDADGLWYKNRETSVSDEVSESGGGRTVATTSAGHNRMIAEKLVLSHPLWRGQIRAGQEFTATRTTNRFEASIAEIDAADNRVDESSVAAFVEIEQQLGRFSVGAGLRCEHVKFDYWQMGVRLPGQSKSYDNLFPSLNVAAIIGSVRMGLNYSAKTVRPSYAQLDGAVTYINRLTFESGNPYLKPAEIQTVEYMAQWRRFFVSLSYSCIDDGVYHVTEPYGADGEAVIIRTANLDRRHTFQAFAGAQFAVGRWQPRVNAGILAQWLTLPVQRQPMKMNTPGFMFQWQNAFRLPFDIWLNVDAGLM
ncbi:MAG: TonB-dependent receptor, partial [Muribaculaceae bacterium]|nr:TonB-dependent receptor [Muribaculaceae bacterium]